MFYVAVRRITYPVAYHPQAKTSKYIDIWYHTHKAVIILFVLLGLRVAVNHETGMSPTELKYGSHLRLLGDFISDQSERCRISDT